MLRLIKYFVYAKSLKVTQVPILVLVFHCNCVYLVPFLKYSASNNGMPLKAGLGVVQGN